MIASGAAVRSIAGRLRRMSQFRYMARLDFWNMGQSIRQFRAHTVASAAFGIVVLGLLALARPADARVFFGFSFPLFVPGPYYYPPPVYAYPPPVYAPPPAYYAPPAGYPPAPAAPPTSGQSCYAGAYVCPMETPVSPGTACYCRSNQGTRVWGQAQ